MRSIPIGHGAWPRPGPPPAHQAGWWPTWSLVLLLAGGAWAHLIQTRVFTAFDPGSPDNLCFGLRAVGGVSFDQLLLASRQMVTEGVVMVLAMMVPGAARAALAFAASRGPAKRDALQRWADQSSWIGGYLAVWSGAVVLAVAALALLRWTLDAQAWPVFAQLGPLLLCTAAGVVQLRAALAPAHSTRHSCGAASVASARWRGWTADAVNAGAHEGVQCVRRCALLMLALHAINGMSLGLMAAYAAIAWWLVGLHARSLNALIGAGLIGAAVWQLGPLRL